MVLIMKKSWQVFNKLAISSSSDFFQGDSIYVWKLTWWWTCWKWSYMKGFFFIVFCFLLLESFLLDWHARGCLSQNFSLLDTLKSDATFGTFWALVVIRHMLRVWDPYTDIWAHFVCSFTYDLDIWRVDCPSLASIGYLSAKLDHFRFINLCIYMYNMVANILACHFFFFYCYSKSYGLSSEPLFLVASPKNHKWCYVSIGSYLFLVKASYGWKINYHQGLGENL